MSQFNFDKQDVIHALKNKLNLVFRAGKEWNGWFELDGKKAKIMKKSSALK